jgi:hypothetical protein
MKILKMLRIILAAMMIGLSCIMPDAHKDISTKYRVEQRDPKDGEAKDELV